MADAKQRILVIEDDVYIAELIRDYLEINNFQVVVEGDGLKGMERALKERFALILLDLMLPGKDGMAICRNIREKVDIPILMVTARIEEVDRVRGLGLGADDYIMKPFAPAELVARVKSHVSRYARLTKNSGSAKPPGELEFGGIRINHATHQVFVDDCEITLTRKEFDLLYFLPSNILIFMRIPKRFRKTNREHAKQASRAAAVSPSACTPPPISTWRRVSV